MKRVHSKDPSGNKESAKLRPLRGRRERTAKTPQGIKRGHSEDLSGNKEIAQLRPLRE
jgi:hypothetical protein